MKLGQNGQKWQSLKSEKMKNWGKKWKIGQKLDKIESWSKLKKGTKLKIGQNGIIGQNWILDKFQNWKLDKFQNWKLGQNWISWQMLKEEQNRSVEARRSMLALKNLHRFEITFACSNWAHFHLKPTSWI